MTEARRGSTRIMRAGNLSPRARLRRADQRRRNEVDSIETTAGMRHDGQSFVGVYVRQITTTRLGPHNASRITDEAQVQHRRAVAALELRADQSRRLTRQAEAWKSWGNAGHAADLLARRDRTAGDQLEHIADQLAAFIQRCHDYLEALNAAPLSALLLEDRTTSTAVAARSWIDLDVPPPARQIRCGPRSPRAPATAAHAVA